MSAPPFEERELAVLVSGVLLFACTARFQRELRRVPHWPLLAVAMGGLVFGNVATVVEHFVAYRFFNIVEHAAYFLQSAALAGWAAKVLRSPA